LRSAGLALSSRSRSRKSNPFAISNTSVEKN